MEKLAVKGSNGDNQKLKEKLCYGEGADAGELLSSWPPIGYTCNFCKRRFNSAQALGGHMNVHRRARAMLRSQSISPILSPTSSPWIPSSITTTAHPFQNDDPQSIYSSPNNSHCPRYTSHHTLNPSSSFLSHLSIIAPSCNNTLSAAACNCKHIQEADQFQLVELRTRDRAKKNCIRAENQLTGVHIRTRIQQEDRVSRLSVGTHFITSNHAVEDDIDLELRL